MKTHNHTQSTIQQAGHWNVNETNCSCLDIVGGKGRKNIHNYNNIWKKYTQIEEGDPVF